MEKKIYSDQEALEASLDYFNGDELAAKVFVDKYALRDAELNLVELTPKDMHRRIAREFARIEKDKFKNPLSEDYIFSLLDGFKYIVPQGSPMYGIGNTYQTISLSNCYLLDVPEDSYGGVMKVDEQLVQISKRRGGTGVDLSEIRPAGMLTNNSSRTSTGIIPFMERYSNSIREVGQAGRRGALMLTLSVHHPQVLDFTRIKNDRTKVTGANISLRLTDEFLNAVRNDEEYELRFPVVLKPGEKPIVSQVVRAREVWMEIIKNAHEMAEPGLLFWDNVTKNTPADCYEEYRSRGTNPCCFSKDSDVFVITKNGIKEIKEVNSSDLIFINETQEWANTSGYFDAGTHNVYRVKFSNGESFDITDNHKLCTVKSKRNGTKIDYIESDLIELKNLSVGDKIAISNKVVNNISWGDKGSYEEGLIMGWLSGDGCLSYNNEAQDYPMTVLPFWEGELDTAEFMHEVINNMGYELKLTDNAINGVKRLASSKFTEEFVNKYEFNIWNFKSETSRNKFLYECSESFFKGYIKSYFTADATVSCNHDSKDYNIQLPSINKARLMQIKYMLNLYGIKSSISLLKEAGETEFKNGGKYQTKDCWRITITGIEHIKKFKEFFGFICKAKQDKLEQICSLHPDKDPKCDTYTTITSIEHIGEKEVGCIEVEKYHKFTANGIISGNSEINLSPLDSCRLLLLNLFSYVNKPFTSEAEFDYDKFYNDSQIAQRLMDDLVDLEAEKIEAIIKKIESDPEDMDTKHRELKMWHDVLRFCVEGRRTGTGITALGDAIAACGIKYGSEESIEMTEKIYRTLKLGAYRSSVDMAKELGSFKAYEASKESACPFIERLRDEDQNLYEDMIKYGRRNIALLTTAPAGSVSILTQTSSGIEPVFMMGYTRRKKGNPGDKDFRVDFVDKTGDAWQEFKVYHPKVKMWMDITGNDDESKSPWAGCCAEDIDWVNRVKLQAAAQRHVCHAISSTINLPNDVTVEKVAEIYEAAWLQGLKGITVYRSGCRDGVLVDTSKAVTEVPEDKIVKTKAPKRKESMPAEVHHATAKGIRYYVAVGLMDGEPYEIFADMNHNSEGDAIIPKAVTEGVVVKRARGRYELVAGDNVYPLTARHNDEKDALTRMISTALRHGADCNFVTAQLEKTRGDLQSFSKVLARTLKKYIEDGVSVSGATCSECKQDALVRESGCQVCRNCGASKCM